jgi:hypothetical protein
MDAFRAALQKLADEQAAGIYQAGQQSVYAPRRAK